ncbi:MAG: hypothetical protein ACK41D_07365 [Rubricoccaceae bacterium]
MLTLLVALSACDGNAPASTSSSAPSTASATATGTTDPEVSVEATSGLLSWADLSDEELWAKVAPSGGHVLVGLSAPGVGRAIRAGISLLNEGQERAAVQAVQRSTITLTREYDRIPVAMLKVSGADDIRFLRLSPFVSYVEPATFEALPQSGNSCEDWGIQAAGTRLLPSGDRMSVRVGRR